MFVEDDNALRAFIAERLADEYVVESAADGEQALSAVLHARPDLIVADVVMPGIDGVELVKTLRSTRSTKTIPVLLTSGRAPEELRIEGFEQGADGYLPKPYTERELRAQIRSMLTSARLRREAAHQEAQEEADRRAMAERAALLESITDAFFAVDASWRFIYVNQRALDFFGKPRDEVLGRVLWDVFPAARGTVFEQEYERAMREGRFVAFESYSVVAQRWLEVHAYPSATGLAINLRDITKRKQSEADRQAAVAKLQGRERRLELATEAAELGIFVWDIQADRVASENLRSYEIFGRTPQDSKLSSNDFLERFLHPEDRRIFEQSLEASLSKGAPLRVTCRIRRQDSGVWRWLELVGGIEFTEQGAPERLIGVLKDITEARRSEEIVRESEARFRTLANAVPAFVFVTDAAGRNIYTNLKFQDFVGVTADELLGERWLDALHPEDRARAAHIWTQAVSSGRPYEAEYRFRRKDGAYRWFLVRGDAVRDAAGDITTWYGTCTDIDDAKRTTEALNEEMDTLETLNRLGRAVAAELDLEHAVQAVTDAATKLSGAAFGAFFYNVRQADGESMMLYSLSGASRESFAKFPMPRKTAVFGPTLNGEEIVRSEDITKDPRYGRNTPHRGMPDGHPPVRSYLAVPVVSRSGDVLGGLILGHPAAGVFTERDERLIAGVAAQAAIAIDNAHLYRELREADRRKDEFLAVLAHELRNPLAPIRNGLQIVRLRASTDPTIQGVVAMMDRQMTHVVRLVDDLLDVSRITSGKLELRRQRVPLNAVLANAVDASRVFIESHGHELSIDVRTEGLTVDGDPERLAQVFANLLSNSAKYTHRGGRIVLTLEQQGPHAVIKVQDNGIGIPAEALGRVFDMFAQVHVPHEATGGLGIGLSLVKRLVEMHDGSIEAASGGPGMGSTFTVQLPLSNAAIERGVLAAEQQSAPTSTKSTGRRVLVVDDNADAAASLAMLLELAGHDVSTASDGEEAVEAVKRLPPEIIFMDIGMPRVDGFEATRRIRRLPAGEDVFIVALTGWGQEADRLKAAEAGMNHHFVKPVSPATITEVFAAAARFTSSSKQEKA